MATASSPVAMSTVASARGTVEIGFIAARTRSGWPLVMPPSRPPARLVERITPSGPGYISSWATLPRRRAVSKPSPISTPLIAWMPITAPASWLSSRLSPLVNEPSPTGSPCGDHLDDAAEGVAVLLGRLDLGDHRLLRLPCRTPAPGWRRSRPGRRAAAAVRRRAVDAPMEMTWETTSTPSAWRRKAAGDGACGDPGGGFAGAGALEHRAGVVEAVLEHAGVVGVAGSWPGQRRVAGDVEGQHGGSTGSAAITVSHLGHSVLPISMAIGPPSVRPWRTPGQHGDLVGFELHPRAAAVAEPAAGQLHRRCPRR